MSCDLADKFSFHANQLTTGLSLSVRTRERGTAEFCHCLSAAYFQGYWFWQIFAQNYAIQIQLTNDYDVMSMLPGTVGGGEFQGKPSRVRFYTSRT